MSIIGLIVMILLVAFALWLINELVSDERVRRVLTIVVIVFLVIWLIQGLGLLGPVGDVRIR